MPSTYTSRGLELQSAGENVDTWGAPHLNDTLQIVNDILSKTEAVAFTSSDVTLTSGQSERLFYTLTGTLSGNVNLIFPQIGASYIIKNSCSGAYTLTIKTSAIGGTTVVAPQGYPIVVVVNDTGADVTLVGGIDAGLGSAEVSLASASTTDVLGAGSLFVEITGTTTINSFGTGANRWRIVRFSGALTLTYNATSLIIPGAASITTASGDMMIVKSDGSSNARIVTYQRANGIGLTTGGNATLTGGFGVTSYSAGTKSSGTFTPSPLDGNLQYATNGGAHTLAAPSADCSITIYYLNNASAGTITFSGFTIGSNTGDALTTTNTSKFMIQILRINSVSTYLVKALQ